jgi:hypothetical protein
MDTIANYFRFHQLKRNNVDSLTFYAEGWFDRPLAHLTGRLPGRPADRPVAQLTGRVPG